MSSESQSKTTMNYHYNPTRMAEKPTQTTPNAGKDVEQQGVSYIAGGNTMQYSLFGT